MPSRQGHQEDGTQGAEETQIADNGIGAANHPAEVEPISVEDGQTPKGDANTTTSQVVVLSASTPRVDIVHEDFLAQQRHTEVIPLNKVIHPLIPFSF